MPCHIQESAAGSAPINDLRLLLPEETLAEEWLELGPEPLQLMVGARRRLLRVVYRRGETSPLTSLEVFPQSARPARGAWSRAHSQDFRSAAKDSPPELQALWVRRGPSHPPLLRLAMITGQWGEMAADEWVELRSQWRMVRFEFSDTLAHFALLAFSIRPPATGLAPA